MLMRMFEGFSDNAKVAIYAAYVESRRLGAPPPAQSTSSSAL